MSKVVIWHNPRCSKSRETLKLLQDRGLDPVVRLYLNDPPTAGEIRKALAKLGGGAPAMMRLKEPAAAAQGLTAESGEETLITAMAATPKLIERPVVFANGKAALGRPPQAVLAIL